MAKNKMVRGKFTGRAQKQRKSAKRPAETDGLAWSKCPAKQKLYSIFLEKSWDSKGQSPWSPIAMGEISFSTAKQLTINNQKRGPQAARHSEASPTPAIPWPGTSR